VALVLTIAVGAFFLIAPIVHAAIPAVVFPPPFPDQHQDAETLLFVLAFTVLLPCSCAFVPRLADRIVAAADAPTLSGVAALLAAGFMVAGLAVRAAGSSHAVLAIVAALWLTLAAVVLGAAVSGRLASTTRVLARRREAIWWLAGCGLVALAVSFSDVGSISLAVAIVGVAVVAVAVAMAGRIDLHRFGRRSGLMVDAAILALLFLAVPNLVVFTPTDPATVLQTEVIHFHQDFFLGPASQVLGGRAMLVDTLSQYGVGSIYFLAALFELIPIGDGTLGLIEGVLSALMFCGGYLVVRAAGVPRLLAATGFAVAVVVLVYGLVYPLGGLLQQGAFRFGLPMAVLVGAVVAARWPRWATAGWVLQLVTMAVASIWALEAFAYTLLTLAAVIATRIWLLPAAQRRAAALRSLIAVVATILTAHVVFALATLVFAGELPHWGWYLTTLGEFLFGGTGELTYDFSRWSPGLALGIVYFASVIALVLILWRRPDLARREPAMTTAIIGTTTMGIALFSYLDNRSVDHIVPYVSLPAVMLAVLWLTFLNRPWVGVVGGARKAALAGTLLAAVLMIAVAASSVGTRFPQSALAIVRPGGESPKAALERLWDPPPLSPGAIEGTILLDRYMPNERSSLVITDAVLGVEILVRSGRFSELPLGFPWEDSLVPSVHLGPLTETVDSLEPGTRMLIDEPAGAVYRQLRKHPDRDPLSDPITETSLAPSGLATLQEWVLQRIGERFRLRTIARGSSGLRVVELEPRS